MTTVIDYALLAGASYYDTRSDINRIPVPSNWSLYSRVPQDSSTGFEASAYTNGAEIVISFAGTDPGDITGDIAADLGLAAGVGSSQLLQAAQYYLQVKASAPAGTTISLTGHSLGGGLASLVAAFFGEKAYTFDQAPFLQSARMFTTTDANGNTVLAPSVVQTLRDDLAAGGTPVDMLAKLDAYIAANNPLNTSPIAADTLAARGSQIVNFNTEGEFLTSWPVIPTSNRIGAQIDIRNYNAGAGGMDLHSQALLTVFLLSNQSAVTVGQQVQSLSEVTDKLQDLLKMIFDKNLYKFDTDKTEENFLERLVKHEAGIGTTLPADAMVKRFTSDMWKLAQDGGMTLRDGNTNPDVHDLSNALIAFAMQKYYEEKRASAGYGMELFTDLSQAHEGSNGIRFDMADVSDKLAAAASRDEKFNLTEKDGKGNYYLKGYQYLEYYLNQDNSGLAAMDRKLIQALLPACTYQSRIYGSRGMVATDTFSRGAFMAGGVGDDVLSGGAGNYQGDVQYFNIDPVTSYVVMKGTGFNWSIVDGGTPYSRKVIGAPTSGWAATDGTADVIYAGKGNDFADGVAGQAGISSLRKTAIVSMSNYRHSIRNKVRLTSRIFHDLCKRKDAASFDSCTGGSA